MKKKQTIVIGSLLAAASCVQGGVQPLPRILDSLAAVKKTAAVGNPKEVYAFFKENFVAGGYAYQYPEETSRVLIPEESGKVGEVSICMDLDANDYSGGAVVLEGTSYDLRPYYATGSLDFWIKGKKGGELCNIVLADDEQDDGIKTEISVDINKYGGIQPYWTHISIPLADFGRRGEYWDEKKQVTIRNPFNWSNVKEFLVTINKGDNKVFRVWVDDIVVLKDQFDVPADLNAPYWDEIKTVVADVPAKTPKSVTVSQMLYDTYNDNVTSEAYGGKTVAAPQPTNNPTANPNVMAFYLDNADYAGITMGFGKSFDLTSTRKNCGGIAFWGKAAPGVDKLTFGINDDAKDGKSTGTSVLLSDFGKIDTSWNYFMIPLKEFGEDGAWWDENSKGEKPGPMDYAAINAITISADKYANRIIPGEPAVFYFDKMTVIDAVPGYVDPDIYWDSFKSSAADKLIFDFEEENELWEGAAGDLSAISVKFEHQNDRALRDTYGKMYLSTECSLNDWAYVGYSIPQYGEGSEIRDWSKHRAIAMDVYCDRDSEIFSVKLKDAGHEAWFANVKLVNGWNKVLVPFRKFRKDPYDQEQQAVVDGKMDLSSVTEFSFSPTTLGVITNLKIDNVKLTNNSKE